jgi:hypothetical protein
MLSLEIADVGRDPFPHVVKEDFLPTDLYENLRDSFPDCPANSGPTGYSYFWGDREYDELISRNAAWKALFEATQSQAFVDYCIRQFRDVYAEYGCTIPLEKAVYVPYCESREDKEQRHLRRVKHQPHELWVRTDILQGHVGYSRRSHLDHRRRLLAILVYFCDAEENRMEGGELVLHPAEHSSAGRDVVIKPRHNRIVAFACTPNSFHSVPEIRSQRGPRNFVQISVSSSVDAWPTASPKAGVFKSVIGSALSRRKQVAAAGN